MSSREKQAELDRLQADIDRALGILSGDIAIGTPRGRALAINAGTDGVAETSLECWRILGHTLYCHSVWVEETL